MFARKGNKWGNKKIEANGEKFDSKLEFERYLYLRALERRGDISDLRRQVSFQLTRRRYFTEQKKGLRGKDLKPKMKVYERASHYIADFVYFVESVAGGYPVQIVEDTKGSKTVEYILKRKMMLEVHNIPVMEITKPCAPIPVLPILDN